MVEEQKNIIMMQVGSSSVTPSGFDSFVNSSSTHNNNNNNNPNDQFFNFDQHNSVSHNSDIFTTTATAAGEFFQFDEQQRSSSSCVLIPCEPNERPSQGLSLSLSSTNPSTIGIQPFELVIRPPPQNHHHHHPHQGYFGKPMINMHEQHHDHMMTEVSMINSSSTTHEYNIRSSKYLVPAQDLLNEFCNLGSTKQNHHSSTKAKAIRSANQWQQDHDHSLNNNNINASSSSSKVKPLNTLEFLELQKRKSKLLQMLDEVDRKYHNYCGQMKAVVSSFEAVAGSGAATVYSSLASKAMSRHFRCLRDGIAGQIKAAKKAMGEKDISAPGATRGETPRLRLLDQNLRQQRAFQQMTMMDSHPWRPQRGLPERSVSILRAWLFEHFLHPYPSDVDKHILARQTGLSRSQVSNWFINARVRLWKPMVEEMYVEETKDNDDHENINEEGVSDRFNAAINDENTTTLIPQMEQKPNIDHLIIRRDSDCLSSIINHHDHHTAKIIDHDIHQSFARVSADPFGAVELDFSAYNHNFGGSGGDGGGGVSLTLGLQQNGGGGGGDDGGGVSGGVALYYPRDHMEDCQNSVQYSSLLEGDQGENLPYRNLMGAQLLHDLAG